MVDKTIREYYELNKKEGANQNEPTKKNWKNTIKKTI
jgi:hypothetical protein